MARVDLPASSLRARRRRRRLVIAAFFVVAALVLLAVFVGLSYLPFLRVTAIDIKGTQTLATSSLAAVAKEHLSGAHWYLFARSNIFLYPKQEITNALVKSFPTLKSVDVHAENFHTVLVSVIERQPKALWCDTNCYFMDEDGVVYADAPDFSEPIYVSYLGGKGAVPHQYLTSEQFHNLSALIDALTETEVGDPVTHVVVDSSGDVHAYYQSNFELMFTLGEASGDVFERYTLAKKSAPFAGHTLSEFEYLDLRFGDKLYYKVK